MRILVGDDPVVFMLGPTLLESYLRAGFLPLVGEGLTYRRTGDVGLTRGSFLTVLMGLVPLPLERDRERERDRGRKGCCGFFGLDPAATSTSLAVCDPFVVDAFSLLIFSPFLKGKYDHRFFDNFFFGGSLSVGGALVPTTSYFSFKAMESSLDNGIGRTSISVFVLGIGLGASILDGGVRQSSVRILDKALDGLGSRVSVGISG